MSRAKIQAPPKEELAEIRKTMTVKGLAKKYYVSTPVIMEWLKMYDIKPPERPNKEELMKLLDEFTIDAIAEKHKCSSKCINSWIKKHDLRGYRTKRKYFFEDSKLIQLTKDGFTTSQIAKELKATYSSIVGHQKRLGLRE